MEHGRAVLVLHALGIAGRAGSVADHAGIGFGAGDPLEIAILRADPVLEGRGVRAAVVADIMLDRGPAILHPVDDGLESRVIAQHAVFSVIDDIFELVVEQARVHRVQHPAHACHAVPADEVARMVHREACDLVARLEAQGLQGLRHLQRIAADARPIGAGLAAIGPAADDLARRCLARGVIDHCGHPHGPVLHGSQSGHGHSPSLSVTEARLWRCA